MGIARWDLTLELSYIYADFSCVLAYFSFGSVLALWVLSKITSWPPNELLINLFLSLINPYIFAYFAHLLDTSPVSSVGRASDF